jgi:hypothetical protein
MRRWGNHPCHDQAIGLIFSTILHKCKHHLWVELGKLFAVTYHANSDEVPNMVEI